MFQSSTVGLPGDLILSEKPLFLRPQGWSQRRRPLNSAAVKLRKFGENLVVHVVNSTMNLAIFQGFIPPMYSDMVIFGNGLLGLPQIAVRPTARVAMQLGRLPWPIRSRFGFGSGKKLQETGTAKTSLHFRWIEKLEDWDQDGVPADWNWNMPTSIGFAKDQLGWPAAEPVWLCRMLELAEAPIDSKDQVGAQNWTPYGTHDLF